MNVASLAGVLRARAQLRSHDRWSRETLVEHQARSLVDLKQFAVANSPFYRELHAGFDDAPLEALPVVTKAMVMERFDDVVTDREVRLADVEAYLDHAAATDTFRGRYRVAATGGTTGRRGVFLADSTEWRTILASYSRAYDWAGVAAGLTNRLRMAVVSSRNPSHQSAIVGATVASRFVPTLRLDATEPLEDLVRELNAFRPDALVGYASILRILAEEQHSGQLAITPRGLMSASEVLTDETRARLRSAFGVEPTNVYGATETAGIASECRHGRLHRYEDLVIAEIVDEANRPVAPGEFGGKLLVTVLFSRTQPLIRYEMSDRVKALAGSCQDGLPFGLLGGIEGREEEVLTLAGVAVHPNVFHGALERVDVAGWQVIDEGGRLRVLLAQPTPKVDPATVGRAVAAALERVGARGIAIETQAVEAIPRTALGKAPLIGRAVGDRLADGRGGDRDQPVDDHRRHQRPAAPPPPAAVGARPTAHHCSRARVKERKMSTQVTQATDPVCGMTVDIASAGASGLTTERDGHTYYFCGRGCKLEFEDDPDRYLDPEHRPSM